MKNIKFDFDDILLQPSKVSRINSRREINPLDGDGFLPILNAPMDTVVSGKNYKQFQDNRINIVLPRGEQGNEKCFHSYSLQDMKLKFNTLDPTGKYLIDVANGHMSDLITLTKDLKEVYPQ
ncbi:MAG: hypothetical protein WD512_10195, partial [Candidatus Paceibacterota bacterium]